MDGSFGDRVYDTYQCFVGRIVMQEIIIQLLSALIGSFGFAYLFNSGKKNLIPATFGGLLAWAVYLLFSHMKLGIFLSTVISAVICQIYSEFFARLLKSPTTVYYIPSIVPLVPGGALYYMLYYAAQNDWNNFLIYGSNTLQVAFGIAVGASFVSALMLLLPIKKRIKNN